jgi:hypothetical protein
MVMIRSALPALIIAVLVGASAAAGDPPENADDRFTFHRGTDDGYWKLDNRTGQVSMCQRRTSGWQCQMVPDERAALEAEIARLQGENGALKKELLSRNLALPSGVRPEPPTSPPGAQRPPDQKDAAPNRIVTMIETAWRRLVEMIASVQQDIRRRI